MDVKRLHHLICNWYMFAPKLTAIVITGMPSGRSPSDDKERKIDLKITIELALDCLKEIDGVSLTKTERKELEKELDKKFPIKKVVMGATQCHLLGRKPGEFVFEKKQAQREEAGTLVKLAIGRLHYNTVKAVMQQSDRVGAPIREENIWHYLQWELGFEDPRDAAKIYWDALYRMSLYYNNIEKERSTTPDGFMVLEKLVSYVESRHEPGLCVDSRTVRRYVSQGLLSRKKIEGGGSNGGPSVWVYDVEETVKRLRMIHEFKCKGLDLATIAGIMSVDRKEVVDV